MNEIDGMSKDIEWIRDSLERIEGRLSEMDRCCRGRHHEIDLELAALRVKAGLYGAVAGAIPAVTAVAVLLLRT
ncbi:MAG TPA: hypothetical protein PLQ76_02790 [bacterium]|nr:hypothetical protein [bacterium]